MMRRLTAGVLVVLLVAVSESGTLAQSPSPLATDSIESSGVAAMLPRHVGALELAIETATGPEVLAYDTRCLSWGIGSTILDDLGKDADDLRVACAFPADPSASDDVYIIALQVDGVAADVVQAVELWNIPNGFGDATLDDSARDVLVMYVVDLWRGAEPWGPAEISAVIPQLQTVGGKRVFDHGTTAHGNWNLTYLAGDVRFMVLGSNGVAMEDVLAELP